MEKGPKSLEVVEGTTEEVIPNTFLPTLRADMTQMEEKKKTKKQWTFLCLSTGEKTQPKREM